MFRDPLELPFNRPSPGHVPFWVRTVVALACAVSFASVTIGSHLLWAQLPSWVDLGYFRNGLTFFISFWILVTLLPPWPLSRALRVSVLLPLAHAIAIGCAWPVWTAIAKFVRDTDAASDLATRFPLFSVVLGTAVAFAVIAGGLARRRSGEWIHGFAMLSLAELLLLGLWLPVACVMWRGGLDGDWWSARDPLFRDTGAHVAFVVIPPTLVAIGFTAFALRRPHRLLEAHGTIKTLLAIALFCAIVMRLDATARTLLLYVNFVPVLLAAALVSVLAIVMLGVVSWLRAARLQRAFASRPQRGGTVVATDGEAVAVGVEITSWLRGPRVVQAPFAVATSVGTLPVHGAHLVAPVVPATTALHVGERLAVLRHGDEVVIAGETTDGGDPFRTSAAPLADAMYVAPATATTGGFASVALTMWRPCIAYLLIVSTIALPALAALLTP